MNIKKRLINIIFYLCVIILLFISVLLNKDYNIIFNNKVINNENTFNQYKNYKFVILDMTKAKETRFSLEDKEKKSIIYTINYKNSNILVELSNSTVITNKITVMKMKDKVTTNMLKNNINEESDKDIIFKKGYYTNINIEKNIKIISIKFYITIVLGIISILLMIFNFIKMIFYKSEIDI